MPAAGPSTRLRPTQVVIWSVFMTLLVVGIALWFRFSDRIVPMLDVISDR